MPADRERSERLQILLTPEELAAIDEFRFANRMPSRAAAARALMTLGLSAAAAAVSDTEANKRPR